MKNTDFVEPDILDTLFIYAGAEHTLKIKEYIELHTQGFSSSVIRKNFQQYILHYQRKDKILHLLLQIKEIYKSSNSDDNDSYLYSTQSMKLQRELFKIFNDLDNLNLPILE